MLRAFNSFQIVSMFAGMPFIVGWLHGEPFAYSGALMWAAVVAYVVMFIGLIACVAYSIGRNW